ncbi:MAG: methyltransferase, partial [Ramlibacter sp.]|nr:methyltransferase [Ramlibacter sp.]
MIDFRYCRYSLGAVIALALLAGCAAGPQPLSGDSIAAIVASPDRNAADRITDIRRRPAQMLAFVGVRPGMVALDVSAARGYTTELIARAVGPAGKVYGQNPPPRAAGSAPPAPPAQPEGAAAPPPPVAP